MPATYAGCYKNTCKDGCGVPVVWGSGAQALLAALPAATWQRGSDDARARWMDVCCNFWNFICDDTTLYPKLHIRYCTWHFTLAIAHAPCHTRFRLPAEIRALHSLFDAEAARKISIAFDLIAAWAFLLIN